MNWILAAGWLLVIGLSLTTRSIFLSFFVLCQFVFVGLGLLAFPAIGMDATADLFNSFDLDSIDVEHFDLANCYVLSGVLIASSTFIVLLGFHRLALGRSAPTKVPSEVNRSILHVAIVPLIVIGLNFIVGNWSGLSSLISAGTLTELGDSFDFRRQATDSYLQVLVIYNILPAFTIVAMLQFHIKRDLRNFTIFVILLLVSVTCLLLTFQKRPLIIFIAFTALGWMLMPTLGSAAGKRLSLSRLVGKGLCLLPAAFIPLFVLYYFYTGIRFEATPLEAFWRINEIIVSRVAGRLSLPAAMYVDYFPRVDPFYGLTNVGLIASITGWQLYADSSAVFSYYSTSGVDGSVAASVFIDAYGQAGVITLAFYAMLIGSILFLIDCIFNHVRTGAERVFFVISSFVFLYYLSQASIFRSFLGYGGAFYFAIWLISFRTARAATGDMKARRNRLHASTTVDSSPHTPNAN